VSGVIDFQNLFEQSPGLFVVLDTNFNVVTCTDAYNKATFTERSQLIGRSIFDLFTANPNSSDHDTFDHLKISLEEALTRKCSNSMPIQRFDLQKEKGGRYEERYWSPCNTAVCDHHGHVLYIIHEVEDVTEFILSKRNALTEIPPDVQRRLGSMEAEIFERTQEIVESNRHLQRANDELAVREKELRNLYERLARQDSQRTQFFANVSHELRTPLTLILGPVEKLLEDVRLSVTQNYQLNLIKRNAYTLIRHVNDLLDIAKFDAGELKPIYSRADVATLVRQIADSFMPLAQEKKLKFLVDTPESLFAVIDADKFQRILMNLMSNAFKFTPTYGTVRCTLEQVTSSQGDRIRFFVGDSGKGIAPQHRQSVFERFYQVQESSNRQSGGTGLGLSIVKDFVDLLRGQIEIKDAPEGGAAFIVNLPLGTSNPVEIVDKTPSESPSISAIKKSLRDQVIESNMPAPIATSTRAELGKSIVLIVEDNPDLRKFIEDSISHQYNCVTAADGAEGLRQAKILKPDLIISDLMMPIYNGEYMVERLKADKDLQDIPVIILTAKADESMHIKLLALGVQDYILKPFIAPELLVRVNNHVRDHRVRKHLQQELNIKEGNLEKLAQDITYKNKELMRMGRLKDEFLATLSHELRTPVSVIFGYSEVLLEELTEPGLLRDAAEAINRNAQTELRLVSDLVDISKSITGKIVLESSFVDIKIMLGNVLETALSAAKAKSIQLKLDIDPKLQSMWGDQIRLTQIIWNLVSNAIKFTPPNGQVAILASRKNDDVEFVIQDSGEGIEPSFIPYLFDRFSQQDGSITRKFGGLGLGLSIVKHLTELHGGIISAESRGLGSGAAFKVRIPLGQASVEMAKGKEQPVLTGSVLHGRTILVVDDEADARGMISVILQRHGMKVITAKSAEEADNVLRDMIPDAIISDIGMPLRNGYEFIKGVRDSDTQVRNVPALALTAFASKQSEDEALKAGFEMYVAKPVDSKNLIQILNSLIQRRQN
jgi:Osmosensitive K+ channel histidine kinase